MWYVEAPRCLVCVLIAAPGLFAAPLHPAAHHDDADITEVTTGRRLGFRGIKRFYTQKQEHQQLRGEIPQHARHYRGSDVSDSNSSWWADKRGNFHSQASQDKTVVKLFANMPASHHGRRFFVDLAANQPIVLSNTRALERDYGWHGICIDGNPQLLEKLLAQRSCDVYEAVVMSKSGVEVSFAAPEVAKDWKQSGWTEDSFGGILSDTTDNRVAQPKSAQRKWAVTTHTSVTLIDILIDAKAPSAIDYLSLDIEGAEYDALSAFNFSAYTFSVLTIERPSRPLRELLRNNGYMYVQDLRCDFGEQLWVHASMAAHASAALDLPPLDPKRDQDKCCGNLASGTPETTIGGCCGYLGKISKCVAEKGVDA